MLSLSKSLARISISASKLPTYVRPLSTSLCRNISVSNELDRGRKALGFFLEEGMTAPRKRAWRNGKANYKGWNQAPEKQRGRWAPARQRTRQIGKDARLSMCVEDLPMLWQLTPMDEATKNRLKDEPSIRIWQENMIERGFEHPNRQDQKEDGAMFLYRTHHQARVARKRRLSMQYENHIIRLRALTKNALLPKPIKAQAKDQLWSLQHGRFKALRGIDREWPICRLHGRPVSVRPRFLVRRQPLRLLTDYGEGICGNMRDFYKRRQREFWTDYLRRQNHKRLPRSWHRAETHYRYAYENTEK